jgi:hypothetical protein
VSRELHQAQVARDVRARVLGAHERELVQRLARERPRRGIFVPHVDVSRRVARCGRHVARIVVVVVVNKSIKSIYHRAGQSNPIHRETGARDATAARVRGASEPCIYYSKKKNGR